MGGFFGTISVRECVNDLFYGTDYNSHLGTKRAGLVTFDKEKGFSRAIHSIERSYFRTKFEDELDDFQGNQGIGVISDTDPQPIIVNSHLGRYAVVTVAKINNIREIADELLAKRMHFSEQSANKINQTELVALLINMGDTFVEGINNVYSRIEGSCSMLILTEDRLIAARDALGRTPIVLGKKEGAYAATSETSAFHNLDFTEVRDLGPGEIVSLKADSIEVLQQPFKRKQICSFLWVYYGFPASDYEGINTEFVRETNGKRLGEQDDVGTGLQRRPQNPVQACGAEIHPDMAALVHSGLADTTRSGGQDEAHTQPSHTERQENSILRRLDSTRYAAARQCAHLLRQRCKGGSRAYLVPATGLRLPVHWLHVIEKRP